MGVVEANDKVVGIGKCKCDAHDIPVIAERYYSQKTVLKDEIGFIDHFIDAHENNDFVVFDKEMHVLPKHVF
jgi:hypothetical protein